ncbi:chromodomain-helicase-DNA-binding protein 2-like, partial [Ruditapes philippinarum]|uniref:chromodomain-helicase-DNA-binding protein 2-like n=1 Tax=Ruditapes philippinarum TaxID=129788 RepID=UPI00295B33AC
MSKTIDNLDITQLDFNKPLFDLTTTTSSLPSTDYQTDENYKYTPPKRKLKNDDGDDNDKSEDSESGSGSNNSSGSGSESDSESASGNSGDGSENSGSEEKSGSGFNDSSNNEDDRHKNDSKSDHPISAMDTDSQDSSPKKKSRGRPRKGVINDLKEERDLFGRSLSKDSKFWQEDPDLYGVRRSSRARQEPTRYNIGSDSDEEPKRRRKRTNSHRKNSGEWNSDSSSDSSASSTERFKPRRQPPTRSKRGRPGRPGRPSKQQVRSVGRPKKKNSSDEEDFSDSEDDYTKSYKSYNKRSVSQKVRGKGRGGASTSRVTATRRGVASKNVSYKEEDSGATDSDDIIEAPEGEEEEKEKEEENKESIEKILDHRLGKKGASGERTTIYNIEENGDLNQILPEDTPKEVQYFIKWKNWA